MPVLKRDDDYALDINAHDVHTILGPESTFEGKLVFGGTVRIDGTFKGEIRTDDVLVVGQSARVEAHLWVGTIIINGEVLGDITAKHAVEIHAPARVRGNICTPQLTITKGVIFEGTTKMEEAARAQAGTIQPNKLTLLQMKDSESI